MVRNYVEGFQNESSQDSFVIRPNTSKIFVKNLTASLGMVFFLLFALVIAYYSLGDMLFDLFDFLGLSLGFLDLAVYIVIGVAILSVVFIALNHMSVKDLSYELTSEKLVVNQTTNLIVMNTIEIPFENIVRIGFKQEGLFDKMFNYGTVSLELSGMRETKVEMEYVFNIEETVSQIQGHIRESLAQKQAEYTENYKIDNILNRPF